MNRQDEQNSSRPFRVVENWTTAWREEPIKLECDVTNVSNREERPLIVVDDWAAAWRAPEQNNNQTKKP